MTQSMKSYDDIYTMVSLIPYGRVATYGQVARLAGRPNGARQVGYALAVTTDDLELPWHRVVNAQGKISLRSVSGRENVQRRLLEQEGVVFKPNGVVDLKRFRWDA